MKWSYLFIQKQQKYKPKIANDCKNLIEKCWES